LPVQAAHDSMKMLEVRFWFFRMSGSALNVTEQVGFGVESMVSAVWNDWLYDA
jgi:hypothetical protein